MKPAPVLMAEVNCNWARRHASKFKKNTCYCLSIYSSVHTLSSLLCISALSPTMCRTPTVAVKKKKKIKSKLLGRRDTKRSNLPFFVFFPTLPPARPGTALRGPCDSLRRTLKHGPRSPRVRNPEPFPRPTRRREKKNIRNHYAIH